MRIKKKKIPVIPEVEAYIIEKNLNPIQARDYRRRMREEGAS